MNIKEENIKLNSENSWSKIISSSEELQNIYENEILRSGYEGWLWLSGKPVPYVVFDPSQSPRGKSKHYHEAQSFPSWEELTEEGNFIWEFKGKGEKRSLSIQHLGGCWMVNSVDLSGEAPTGTKEVEETFLTKKLGRKIKFSRFYVPCKDPFGGEPETLHPAWSAFMGFGLKNEEKEPENGNKRNS